jgi:hypothetical protein
MIQIFPDNEVRKGQLTMQLKRLRQTQEGLSWPLNNDDLPVISWESCMSLSCTYILLFTRPFFKIANKRRNGLSFASRDSFTMSPILSMSTQVALTFSSRTLARMQQRRFSVESTTIAMLLTMFVAASSGSCDY